MSGNRLKLNQDRCKGCELCIHVCPNDVLALELEHLNEKGYRPVTILKPDRCIHCGMCSIICPDLAILLEPGRVKKEGAD